MGRLNHKSIQRQKRSDRSAAAKRTFSGRCGAQQDRGTHYGYLHFTKGRRVRRIERNVVEFRSALMHLYAMAQRIGSRYSPAQSYQSAAWRKARAEQKRAMRKAKRLAVAGHV